MDPYVDLTWVVYMQMCSQLIQNVNISFEISANLSGEYGGASWIPIRIRHRSLYGSYMDPYVDLIWVVYM